MKQRALSKRKSIWNTSCNLKYKNIHRSDPNAGAQWREEGSRESELALHVLHMPNNTIGGRKWGNLPYTEYETPLMRRSDSYHKSQTKTTEAEDWSAEEKLNLFLVGRWTFGPGSPGSDIAKGNTHEAQGSAALQAGEQEPVWESLLCWSCGFCVWCWWNICDTSSRDPITDAWTGDLLMPLENCEFSFQASRQGYC